MINAKKRLGLVMGSLLAGVNAATYADVQVKVFVQNIEANKLCKDKAKQDKLLQYLADNKFDFILIQEYEDICAGLFESIQWQYNPKKNTKEKVKVYNIATGKAGDSTIFYRNTSWTPSEEMKVNTTSNTPDGWGHDGTRIAIVGSYQKMNSNTHLIIGNAHLCVTYQAPVGYSKCVVDEPQAHLNDFANLTEHLEHLSGSQYDWIMAGDMNANKDSKPPLLKFITDKKALNINELNNQNFDMAFYKNANKKITDMKFENVDSNIANISDHKGFVLRFNLKE